MPNRRATACLALMLPAMAVDMAMAMPADPDTSRAGGNASRLLQRIETCELAVVSQALGQVRQPGPQSETLDALRVANGRCTRFVLALTPLEEVARVCSSVPAWSAARTARELRRRMAAIEADAVLRTTAVGQACRAAYAHELKTTRVVLRSAPR